ncbi:monocarboxylate transporter 13-like [Tubulanus polymorphus]|uniref:monocarboxylate transporter 13-like n=1 Tax=Tubulanus polymorphus TaxID=672921 RepID=UPI003DA1D652
MRTSEQFLEEPPPEYTKMMANGVRKISSIPLIPQTQPSGADNDNEKRKQSTTSQMSSIETSWSWFVMVSSFFCHFLIYGVCWSVGVYYVVFLEEFQQDAGATSWIGAIQVSFVYFSGPLGSVMMNRFGYRPMMVAGTLLASLGLTMSMFATSIYHLYATFGILTGLGIGIAYVPSITAVGSWFDRHRTLAIGIACSGCGAGSFVFPRLIRFLVELYGWRGSLLVLAGINLNIIVFSMFMLPSPKDERDENINKKLIQSNSNSLFNHHILIKKRYLLLSLNNLLYLFGMAVVYGHLSNFAKIKLDIQDDNTSALLFSYLGLANFAGRLFFGLLGHHPKINVILAYACATFVGGVATIVMPFATSYTVLIVLSILFGFFTGCIGSYMPDLVIKFLDIHHLAVGYGCLLVYEGTGTLLGGPVAGWLFDLTLDYDVSFYVGGATMMIAAICLLPSYKCMKPSPHEPDVILPTEGSVILSWDNIGNGDVSPV